MSPRLARTDPQCRRYLRVCDCGAVGGPPRVERSLCGLGFGADQLGDSWVMAELVQAPAAVRPHAAGRGGQPGAGPGARPDAAGRDAKPGADLGVRHGCPRSLKMTT